MEIHAPRTGLANEMDMDDEIHGALLLSAGGEGGSAQTVSGLFSVGVLGRLGALLCWGACT